MSEVERYINFEIIKIRKTFDMYANMQKEETYIGSVTDCRK